MKRTILPAALLVVSVVLTASGCYNRTDIPGDGILTREILADDRLVELSGQWEFYREEFYLGGDFSSGEAAAKRVFLDYRGDWKKTGPGGAKIQEPGYATYRLKITLKGEPDDRLLLRIPYYDMAVNLYCNGHLIFSNGTVDTSPELSEIISYYPYITEAVPENGVLDLVMHASSYRSVKGGVREAILIGYRDPVSRYSDIISAVEMMLIGCLLIMSIYNIILFLVMKRNPLYLYFALVCLAASLHAAVGGTSFLGRLGVSWDRLVMIRYLSWISAVYFYYLFFTRMFKHYSNVFVSLFYTAAVVLCCIIVITAPFSKYSFLYYPVTFLYLFSIAYFLSAAFNEFIKRRENSTLLLVSFVLLFPIMYLDKFSDSSITRFNIVSPLEIVLFCIIQSVIIGKKNNMQYKKNSELTAALRRSNVEMTVLNKHLEHMVEEKTDELRRQNVEISEQNRQIRDMNRYLEERIKTSVTDLRQKDDMLTIQSRQAAMGEMLGFIGHQWKQNIYAISLYTEALKNLIIRDGELNRTAAGEILDKIDSFVIAMFNTFSNFTNFIKPMDSTELFSIKGAVDETIGLMRDFITINSVSITFDCKGDPVLEGLTNELEQVVMNILKNSIDAFNERDIKDRCIWISVYAEEGINYIRIIDNAGGIHLDNPGNVFDKFYTSKETGTGLGLYIARIVIEQRFNGSILARNTGDGAEFIITIPEETVAV